MAAITSFAAGNVDVGANWVGGVAPGNGDTCTVAHDMHVPNGFRWIIGSSPADETGTAAIFINITGKLTVDTGGTCTYRGPVRMNRGLNLVVQAGGIWEHDSSLAAVPANANYQTRIGQNNAISSAMLFNGVAGVRAICRIAAGSGPSGGFNGNNGGASALSDCGQVRASFTTFTDQGNTTGYFMSAAMVTAGTDTHFDNCLMDRCGRMIYFDIRNNTTLRYLSTTYRNTVFVSGPSFGTDLSSNGFSINPTLGERRIQNCHFDGISSFANASANASPSGLILDEVTFSGAAPLSFVGGMGVTHNNVLIHNTFAGPGGGTATGSGNYGRWYYLRANGGNNPHFHAIIKHAVAFDGGVFEVDSNTGAGNGDLFQTEIQPGAVGSYNISVKNVLVIPQPDGKSPGAFVNHSDTNALAANNQPNVTVENCTFPVDDAGSNVMACGGENNNSIAGQYVSNKGNLMYCKTAGAGWVFKWHAANTAVNGAVLAINNNCRAGMTGLLYHRIDTNPGIYPANPGVDDVVLSSFNDIKFVDPTRNFLKWGQSIDSSLTTWAQIVGEIAKRNDDTGYNPGFTIAALYDWVRAGWAPRNRALRNASHTGGVIGAIPFAETTIGLRRAGRLRAAVLVGALALGTVHGNTWVARRNSAVQFPEDRIMADAPKTETGPAKGGSGTTGGSAGGASKPGQPTASGGTATSAAGITTAAPSANGGVKPATDAQQIASDLQKTGVAPGANTAAGVAISEARRDDAGTHFGEEPAGDIPESNESGPVGDQLKPAVFTPGGSLPNAQVATPTGLVPASVVGDDKVAAKIVEERDASARTMGRRPAHRTIDDATLDSMTRASIRAVAFDRGYDIGEGGSRVMRERFKEAQRNDALASEDFSTTDPRAAK
jgi:hypothetical protein